MQTGLQFASEGLLNWAGQAKLVAMLVFVYEFITGGGLLAAGAARLQSSLAREGAAMATALAADFAELPRTSAGVLRDFRAKTSAPLADQIVEVRTAAEHDAAFERLAARADWSVVIAPEIGGRLSAACRHVEKVGGRLLGPPPAVCELAGDKQATAEHLAAAGVSTPRGRLFCPGESPPADQRFPAIVKPRDGAGSQGVRLVDDHEELRQIGRRIKEPHRFETYCPGTPVSVACLCGPEVCVPLAPCRQFLSDDGCFRYLGGSLPLPDHWARRATQLATRAVATFHALLGYLSVDIILGDDPDGRDDVVIEINPRMTTSYVGLRAAAEGNLAAAMLEAAARRLPTLSFRREPLRFDPDGNVWQDTPAVSHASVARTEDNG